MSDDADVREIAMSLAGVVEAESDGFDFKVGRHGFVWSYPERSPGRRRIIRLDIADLYVDLLERPAEQIAGETFNAGYENFTVSELADQVRKVVEQEFPEKAPIPIETTPSNDLRSYHVSSKKILQRLGWAPRRTIEDAVRDLCKAFKAGKLPNSMDDDRYINVKTVKQLALR